MIHLSELKGQEGAHILNFLREHVHTADDITARWQWEAGSVAFWDNRVITHRAVPGGYNPSEREGKRTAVFGERPYYDPGGESLTEQKLRNGEKVEVSGNGVDAKANGVHEKANGVQEQGFNIY